MNVYISQYEFSGTKREENIFQKELAKKLLNYCIFKESGVKADELTVLKNSHGKPYFSDFPIKYNISHCRSAVAVATGTGDVGVDIEKIRDFKMVTAKYISSDNEYKKIIESENQQKEFFALWTFKEAFVKMLGAGISYSLKNATQEAALKEYPKLYVYTSVTDGYSVTAMENGGALQNIIKINYRDIL